MPKQTSYDRNNSLRLIGYLCIVGVVAMLVYSLSTKDLMPFFSISSSSLLLAGAAIALGGLVGFMFGIPRTENSNGNKSINGNEKANGGNQHRANTNLEQISDWLTKILVGAGLTQLTVLPGQIQDLAEYTATHMGHNTSSVYTGAILLYFVVIGFMYAYLRTRLTLSGEIKHADDQLADLLANSLGALGTVEQKLGDSEYNNFNFQELRQQTEKVLASIEPRTDAKKTLGSLTCDYDNLRTFYPAGPDRTMQMATIFAYMRSVNHNISCDVSDIVKMCNSESEGNRLAAIAFTQVKPDPAYFDVLIIVIQNGKSAFEQYQALKSLELILKKLNKEQKTRLKEILSKWELFEQNSDRGKVATQLLIQIEG